MARNRKLQNRIGLPHITDEAEAAIAAMAVVTAEQVEDFVGGMLDGTETFINVSYDDTDGNLDFVVPVKDEGNMTSNSSTYLSTQQSIKTYVDTEVAGIIDSSPAALNTLNELAAALGDDANYATTTTTALGNRLRTDTNSQGLSSSSQVNALTNLGITATKAEINILVGGLSTSEVPNLPTSKITTGTFATAMIADNAITAGKLNVSGDGTTAQFLRSDSDGSFTWAVPTDTNTQLTQEQVEDYIYGLLTSGSNITLNYVDASGTLTISSQDTTYTSSDFTHNSLSGVNANEHIDWAGSGTGTIHPSNYTDTTYSVGDGGLTQINFTSADNTKLDGIAASANNYSISSDLLDEDNMVSNSTTKVATQQSIKAYVDAEVTGLIDSSPATLNTLNELAAALGDDASFSTTIATSIGTKLAKASNLSDLTNVGTARTNLGLGTAATLSGTGAVANLNTGLVTGDTVYDYIAAQGYGVGDITSVVAGTGLSGGATSGDATLNLQLSEFSVSTADGDGDYFIVNDTSHASKRLTKANINLSGFNNDGFATLTGSETLSNKTLTTPNLGTPSAIVLTNATGAPTWNQSTTGTAAGLTTSRTLASHGDVVWNSGAFNGTGNVTGQAVIQVDAVDIPMLSATGTASSSTYLRGDNTWATVSQLTLLDQDDMSSNSATAAASQQSVKAYVDSEVANLVDSSPAALNTLNELAAALGDDASFSSTITTSIGTKLAKASNLSDLTNAGTARSNLGLGTGAVLSTAVIANGGAGLATADQIHTFVTGLGYQTTAGSAATWTNSRTISSHGDVVWSSGAVNGSGNVTGQAIIQAGAVDIPMLSATGTASSSTYLRGDNTWATVAAGGATDLDSLTDVISNITNFTNSILISSDGATPPTGTLSSATGNVGIGKDNMTALTSGVNNIAIGLDSGKLISSGSGNIAMGWRAGVALTTGEDNVIIGGRAGSSVSTNSAIVAIGYDAGRDTTAPGGVFIGKQAGGLTTSSYAGAVAIGYGAGKYGVDGYGSIAIGYNAMEGAAATGAGNQGWDNIAMGINTMKNVSTGEANIAIGASAGYQLTTGSRNIAIGRQTADGFDTESDNIAIGYQALGGAVAGGEKNIVIGNYAGDALTSADGTVMIGYNAGTAITTMLGATLIGYQAGMNATTGTELTAIGYNAARGMGGTNTTTAIGYNAMGDASQSYGTTAVGHEAGLSASGSANTLLGRGAGRASTGNRNTFLGSYAGNNNTSGYGNVLIGAGINNAGATDSQQLKIWGANSGGSAHVKWIEGDSSGVVNFPNSITVAGSAVGGASDIGGLTDVISNIANFADSILISPDGAAPPHGTLNAATGNVGMGKDVFAALTSGDYNLAIGFNALNDLTTGGSNVAIGGYGVLEKVTTQSGNVAIGSSAGRYITNGPGNVFVGNNSGRGNASGVAASYNVGIGYGALYAINGVANNNVGIGKYALRDALTTGDDNIAIGESAGRNISTASELIFIGTEAGTANSTGLRNIAIGAYAYNAADTESDNIAIGYDALGGAVAGGEKNLAIGNYAGDAITSGSNNILLGQYSGSSLTTSPNNIAIGVNALDAASTGWGHNIAIGSHAMGSSATTGGRNIAIGSNALKNNTSDYGNVAIGYQALEANTGSYNTAVGDMAGKATTGYHNTMIGWNAGVAVTSGSSNITIGKQAGDNITSGSGNVVIGKADVPSATASDQLSISSGDGSPVWITGNAAGVVNIPGSLTVAGSAVGGASSLDELSDVNLATNYSVYYGNSITHDNASYNTSLGSTALDSITTGSSNTVFGAKAGTAITDSTGNILVGSECGTTIVTGASYNIGIGGSSMNVGDFNGSNYNIGIGAFTMRSCEGGDNNIGIGGWSAKEITSGSNNVGLGYSSIKEITTGSRNIGIGTQALDAADTESDNIAIGYDALGGAVAGGEKNVVIGNYAGDALTSSDHNIMIGYQAGTAITTGNNHVIIGHTAGAGLTNQATGVFVGYRAGFGSTGWSDTLIGSQAGTYSGGYNAVVGHNAMTAGTGTGNVFVGWDSGLGVANNAAHANVGLGKSALKVLTTGGSNIAIGPLAGDNITSGSNNVVIGKADVTATGSDQLSISSGDGSPVWITGNNQGVVDFPNGFTNNGAGAGAPSANPMFTNKVGSAAKYYPAGYENVISNTQRTHSILTNNTYFYPFRANYTGTVTGLSIYTTGFTQPDPSTLIVAIYDSDSDGAPQTRLGYNTFTTSGVSSGTYIGDTAIDDSYDTTAGQIYWMAFTATGGTVGLYGWDRKPMLISSTQSPLFYYNYMRFSSGGSLPAATVNTANLYQGNQASMPNVVQTYSGL
jgi:trimeric autotransporter adhesin